MENTSLNFLENWKGNVILKNLKQQREEGKFCDIVLVVSGKKFPAHRSVLAASSSFFESILKTHRIIKEEINIGWRNAETFDLFLSYIYSGSITLTDRNVHDFLRLSSHFLVPTLKSYCEQFLVENISLDCCIDTKELAEKYDLAVLHKRALTMIRKNINTVIESDQFMQFSRRKLELFITHPETGCDSLSLKQLLNAVSSWVHHDPSSRSLDLVRLLDVINWQDVPVDDVYEHLDSHILYQESRLCLFILLRTLVLNKVDIAGHSLQFEELHECYEDAVHAYDQSKDMDFVMAGSSLLDKVSSVNSPHFTTPNKFSFSMKKNHR